MAQDPPGPSERVPRVAGADGTIPWTGRAIPYRWCTRTDGAAGPAVLSLHGGAQIMGDLDQYEGVLASYVEATGVPFLAIDNTLAPEGQGSTQADEGPAAPLAPIGRPPGRRPGADRGDGRQRRRSPAIPRLGWDVVDVRDVAELHLLAMDAPAAAGRRLLGGSGSFLRWQQRARLLREARPAIARRIASWTMPDAVIAVLSVFDRRMAMMRPMLGREVHVDAGRTRDLLGWEPARTAEQSVLDTADDLVASGAIDR